MRFTVHNQDCREAMAAMDAASIDAIVTDPPYGLSFMGKGWDHGVPGVEFWTEAIRVAKPGTHLLAFGGTRTFHRLTCAIEDAGWEIRDCIMWVYGSGFPKSHNVSKAIDKAEGAERAVVGIDHEWIKRVGLNHSPSTTYTDKCYGSVGPNGGKITAPATDAARQWSGWGTALKPAWEPIIVARKPLVGTVAENVLRHGTGGINVDGCRVGTDENLGRPLSARPEASSVNAYNWSTRPNPQAGQFLDNTRGLGRWPANVIHDGSDEVVGLFPVTAPSPKGIITQGGRAGGGFDVGSGDGTRNGKFQGHGDSGSAARFFYCAKASKADRGCDNNHPTVKPTDLMRYLCRLVTPPHGTVFDPFCGSGSTGKAAVIEGFDFIGCELDQDYARIAESRIAAAMPRDLFIGAGP